MKNLIIIIFIAVVVIGCMQTEDYKSARDEVMEFHDLVMADHNKIVNNQMKLDTLLKDMKNLKAKFPDVDTLKEKDVVVALLSKLAKTEDSMNNWMNKFEPDVTGKDNDAAIKYFQNEKAKIVAIDSLYKEDIKSSDEYLIKFNK